MDVLPLLSGCLSLFHPNLEEMENFSQNAEEGCSRNQLPSSKQDVTPDEVYATHAALA